MTTNKPFIVRLLEQAANARLIRRMLGFYQTPCTILDGVQYSWPIPLDVCHTDNKAIDRPVVWHVYGNCQRAVSEWLTVVDQPLHSDIKARINETGGGRSREELE